MTQKSALVVVAHGSESLETITVVNVLRRGGIETTLASIEDTMLVDGTRGVTLVADEKLDAVGDRAFDLVVLPGGEVGAKALGAHAGLAALLHRQRFEHRYIGAICAAPAFTLTPQGLLDGKQATGYPAYRDALLHYVDLPVVVDGHTVTGQGPASALPFGLMLVEKLAGEPARRRVAEEMLAA